MKGEKILFYMKFVLFLIFVFTISFIILYHYFNIQFFYSSINSIIVIVMFIFVHTTDEITIEDIEYHWLKIYNI
jgi:hypothetical protein